MTGLPFTLAPHRDEILGSWLGRNELHNGGGAWRAMIRETGANPYESNAFDIPDFSPALETLFKALGAPSYEAVLLNLTTLPYWLAFDAAPREKGILKGTANIPLLYNKNGELIRSPERIITRYRSRVGIRYCPACLTQDTQATGEPFWHRLHQLPNVTTCPEHHLCLLSMCLQCGRRCAPDLRGRIPLPRIACVCGYDLSAAIVPPTIDEVRLKLRKISAEALMFGDHTYDRSQIYNILLSRASLSKQKEIITEVYGGYATSFHEAERKTMDALNWVWFPDYRHMHEARAVNVCALLAALDLEFPTPTSLPDKGGAIRRRGGQSDVGRRVSVPTVYQAQQFMLRQSRTRPGVSPSYGTGIYYWVLRLFDPDWLTQHFPRKTRFATPPSINVDRARIRERLAGQNSRTNVRSDRRTLVAQSAAGLRARIRDQSWLRKQYAQLDRSLTQGRSLNSIRSNQSAKAPIIVQQARNLRNAFRAALLEEGYPSPLTVTELAARAQLGFGTAKNALRYDPVLFAEVRQARRDLPRRRIIWAVRQLKSRNNPLALQAILTYARVRENRSNKDLVRRALAELIGNGAGP